MGKLRVALWDAINEYTKACHGDPSRHVHGNTVRQLSVSAVERAVDAETLTLTRERDEAIDCGQSGVCMLSPGCSRHWYERNVELTRERDAARAEVERARASGIAEERARVVAWLRSLASEWPPPAPRAIVLTDAAIHIERGDHDAAAKEAET